MSAADTARTYYEKARDELCLHIRLRDQALFLYLASVAGLFGAGFSRIDGLEILLVVPLLALGAAIIVSQHDVHIGRLALYTVSEIQDALVEAGESATPWDASDAMRSYEASLVTSRLWGHVIIIALPAIAALVYNASHALRSPFPEGVAWWLGALSTGGALLVFWHTAGERRRLQTDGRSQERIRSGRRRSPEDREPEFHDRSSQ